MPQLSCIRADPAGVSLNQGVVLCIECGAVHRKLGVHISQVRSTALDIFKPDQIAVRLCVAHGLSLAPVSLAARKQQLKAMGNNMKLNREIYEAEPAKGFEKISADSPADARERYIRAKVPTRIGSVMRCSLTRLRCSTSRSCSIRPLSASSWPARPRPGQPPRSRPTRPAPHERPAPALYIHPNTK